MKTLVPTPNAHSWPRKAVASIEAENEDTFRVRKANEFWKFSRELENEARRQLARAVDQTALAKSKYEATFAECEKRACARRKAGLIEVIAGY